MWRGVGGKKTPLLCSPCREERERGVEVFFPWNSMLTSLSADLGWQAHQPITLPAWDLASSTDREDARCYLRRIDPDFIMLAPPCAPWSTLQRLNQKTPMQIRRLRAKRTHARVLLKSCEELIYWQCSNGRAVAIENLCGLGHVYVQ